MLVKSSVIMIKLRTINSTVNRTKPESSEYNYTPYNSHRNKITVTTKVIRESGKFFGDNSRHILTPKTK